MIVVISCRRSGSAEKPAAREPLSSLKIYVECLSPHLQWQVHPGDRSSKGFYEALKLLAVASDFEAEEVGGMVSPGGETGLGCSLLDSFSRFMGARQGFSGI